MGNAGPGPRWTGSDCSVPLWKGWVCCFRYHKASGSVHLKTSKPSFILTLPGQSEPYWNYTWSFSALALKYNNHSNTINPHIFLHHDQWETEPTRVKVRTRPAPMASPSSPHRVHWKHNRVEILTALLKIWIRVSLNASQGEIRMALSTNASHSEKKNGIVPECIMP